MSVAIEKVTLNPSTINTGTQFLISVKVQVSTYERLKAFMHSTLKKFTYSNLKNNLLK